jgi:hypothetical protein
MVQCWPDDLCPRGISLDHICTAAESLPKQFKAEVLQDFYKFQDYGVLSSGHYFAKQKPKEHQRNSNRIKPVAHGFDQ